MLNYLGIRLRKGKGGCKKYCFPSPQEVEREVCLAQKAGQGLDMAELAWLV